jgi:GTP cyclohydrolase IA
MRSHKALVKVMQPKRDEIGADSNIAPQIREILAKLGEDPGRQGLQRTPERVDQALKFLTSGYRTDINKVLNGALYEVKYDEMVVVRDIEFFSMCEHHLLPFFGKIHVAYIPRSRVIGLSKIPRIVDVFARRLQIQERLTQEVAQTIEEVIIAGGGRCDLRSPPLLHDDARGGKAALRRHDERHVGCIPDAEKNARRIPLPGEPPELRVLGRHFAVSTEIGCAARASHASPRQRLVAFGYASPHSRAAMRDCTLRPLCEFEPP